MLQEGVVEPVQRVGKVGTVTNPRESELSVVLMGTHPLHWPGKGARGPKLLPANLPLKMRMKQG